MKARQIIGGNRSGALRSPDLLREMIAATEEFPPSSRGDARGVAETRVAYAREGEPAATMPPPRGAKDLASKALKALRGATNPNMLLDKLGERLAYERSGVRLYDALLSKHDAFGSFTGGPTRAELQHIRDEELQHFTMLAQAVQRLGGDPTAVTPSANVQATATLGICQALTDPRIDLLSSLELAQVVELADNDCWSGLIELLRDAGEAETARAFEEALGREREHLMMVRRWVAAGQGRSAERIEGASAIAPMPTRRGAGERRAHTQRKTRRSSGAPKRAASSSKSAARGRKSGAKKTGRATKATSAKSRGGGKRKAARRR